MFQVRGMHLSTLCRATIAGLSPVPKPRNVFLCIADHFEPDWKNASNLVQQERVQRWVQEYPSLFSDFEDSRGRSPQHSFFYPIEVYDESHIDQLTKLVCSGHGDIEVHLHHENDCAAKMTEVLEHTLGLLHNRHGLLSRDTNGQIRYGFIHGNWSLDNSHPDGKWCGVNDELTVLIKTGCYADFTMPAAPHPAQTTTINAIYYATDDPNKPKSHDRGLAARVGRQPKGESLLLIQGPLSVTVDRKGLFPKVSIENGNLAGNQPPTPRRLRRWLQASVSVEGRPDWIFVKLHTHGAQEQNMTVLLGEPMQKLHETLAELSQKNGFQFFYVTARELAQLVHQAEKGFDSPDFQQLSW